MRNQENGATYGIDAYLRRQDTVVARTLRRIAPPTGEDYVTSKTKRALDLSIAIPAAIVATPMIAFLAGVNKYRYPNDPAFFRQQRVAHNGEEFTMTKIRSMKPDSSFEQNRNTRKTTWEGSETTAFGNLLRRTDLDELPQMFQVVTGRLSLLGPRPINHPVEIDFLSGKVSKERPRPWSRSRYEKWKKMYDGMRLGLSGIHQVVGYDAKEERTRFHREMFYMRHASLGFDLYLLWRTYARITRKIGKMRR